MNHALAALLDDPALCEFRTTLAQLERAAPEAPPLGGLGPVEAEQVRLRPPLTLNFPASEITDARMVPSENGERVQITTPLMGLYGPSSPLPTAFTERLMALDEASLPRGFLDLIHHRVLSLLFRALTKYRPAFAAPGGATDHASHRLAALVGLPADQPGATVRSDSLLCYAGILARQPRGAETLEHILTDRFGVPCEVEQCIGRWTELPEEQTCRLGQRNSGLGSDCTVGSKVFSRSTAFRVYLGPLPWQDLERFHPGGDRHAELRELVRAIDGQALDCEVELVIELSSVPPAKLGSADTRLGWTTRLDGRTDSRTTSRFLLT